MPQTKVVWEEEVSMEPLQQRVDPSWRHSVWPFQIWEAVFDVLVVKQS
jgi:hypothetical protein